LTLQEKSSKFERTSKVERASYILRLKLPQLERKQVLITGFSSE